MALSSSCLRDLTLPRLNVMLFLAIKRLALTIDAGVKELADVSRLIVEERIFAVGCMCHF